ncbi:hypothetical protein EON66_06500 [archaeon]|nr:MAG: hypothetical protein EON66_06500 [archaeon]
MVLAYYEIAQNILIITPCCLAKQFRTKDRTFVAAQPDVRVVAHVPPKAVAMAASSVLRRGCDVCVTARPVLKRPKDGSRLCRECFLRTFEDEVHTTIVSNSLFQRGERVIVGASGGKDSTVLAHVLTLLNERHDYGLNLILLSIDEGTCGLRAALPRDTPSPLALPLGMRACAHAQTRTGVVWRVLRGVQASRVTATTRWSP